MLWKYQCLFDIDGVKLSFDDEAINEIAKKAISLKTGARGLRSIMEEIVKVHYPDIEENLLNNAMEVFYWIRGIRDIRKKPSTSELIDWVNALMRSGIPVDTLKEKLPFLGVIVKKDEDLDTVRHYVN